MNIICHASQPLLQRLEFLRDRVHELLQVLLVDESPLVEDCLGPVCHEGSPGHDRHVNVGLE